MSNANGCVQCVYQSPMKQFHYSVRCVYLLISFVCTQFDCVRINVYFNICAMRCNGYSTFWYSEKKTRNICWLASRHMNILWHSKKKIYKFFISVFGFAYFYMLFCAFCTVRFEHNTSGIFLVSNKMKQHMMNERKRTVIILSEEIHVHFETQTPLGNHFSMVCGVCNCLFQISVI